MRLRKFSSLIAGLLLGASLFAQSRAVPINIYAVSLTSGTTPIVSLNKPVGDGITVLGKTLSLYCSKACEFTLEKGGTPSGSTATPTEVTGTGKATGFTVYSSATVTSTSTIYRISLPDTGAIQLDISDLFIYGTDTGTWTLRAGAALTGNATLNWSWRTIQ